MSTSPRRIYVHEFDKPDVEIEPDQIVVFQRADGASVRVMFDNEGEVYVSNDDGRLDVSPRSTNALILRPHSRAVEIAARRTRKAIGRDGAIDYASLEDVRTLIEAALS